MRKGLEAQFQRQAINLAAQLGILDRADKILRGNDPATRVKNADQPLVKRRAIGAGSLNNRLIGEHDIAPGDYSDPGWYRNPPGTVASRVSSDPDFGAPVRRNAR
mgnify:CR=1 FL=1